MQTKYCFQCTHPTFALVHLKTNFRIGIVNFYSSICRVYMCVRQLAVYRIYCNLFFYPSIIVVALKIVHALLMLIIYERSVYFVQNSQNILTENVHMKNAPKNCINIKCNTRNNKPIFNSSLIDTFCLFSMMDKRQFVCCTMCFFSFVFRLVVGWACFT